MDFLQERNISLNQTNWQKICQQLLLSYYQLAQNYRSVVNQNQQLSNLLKQTHDQTAHSDLNSPQKHIKTEDNSLRSQKIKVIIQKSSNQQKQDIQKRSQSPRSNKKNQLIDPSKHVCTYQNCNRVYDSSVSLNLHMKLKHNGGTKKERQTYAKIILDAQEKGLQPPKVNINFPPGFLEEFRNSYEYMKKYNM